MTFAVKKYHLVHFTRNRKGPDTRVTLEGHEIQPEDWCRVLGVQIDRRLRWDTHIQSISKKMATQVYALDRIAGSTWGASLQRARQVYTAVVRSAIGYGASEWHHQIPKNRAKTLSDI